MKQSLVILSAVLLLLILSSPSFGAPVVRVQQSPGPTTLPPPISIRLTAIPDRLPPGGSGVIIVQLVGSDGNPSPARADVPVSLFSSGPTVLSVSQQVTVAFGKSHAEVQVRAGTQGVATVTGTANGLLSGSTTVSTSIFSDFALQLVPLNNPVSPGDSLELRVGLMASGKPFNTPTAVQVSITTSIPDIAQQTLQVQPRSCCAYASVSVPASIALQTIRFMTVTAAAPGFTSATAAVSLSPQGSNPQVVLVGPPRINLTAGGREFLSVSLFNDSFVPAAGSLTISLFSSNSSVVKPLASQVSMNGADSAIFPLSANATGTAQITAIAPGLSTLPLTVRVVGPLRPTLRISVPPTVRVGEAYSFSVGFYDGTEPVPYGPIAVYTSSSNLGVTVPSSLEASALGYALGTLSARSPGVSNITAVLEGVTAATAAVTSVFAPVVAPVKYAVSMMSESGPLVGMPVNFTYGGRTSVVAAGTSGTATFAAYNDTATSAIVPTSVTLNNRTYFFTGWSNGIKSENISLLASAPTYSITAQYFRSVVPTTYSVLAISDQEEPVVGLRFNVSSRTLARNFTLTTNIKGTAEFVLSNASSFTISVPELFQPSGQTRYTFLSMQNTTNNALNMTASAPITVKVRYATYYRFQVDSPIGNATGSGWYRSGSSAYYSLGETSSGGPLVFQRFAGWTGSFSSNQPAGSAVINSPQSITAQWSTDSSLVFALTGGTIAAAAAIGLVIFRLRKRIPPS